MNYMIVLIFLSAFVGIYFTLQTPVIIFNAIKNNVDATITMNLAFASIGWAALIALLTN